MGRQLLSAELEKRISVLAGLPRADLIERWQKLYGCDPPKGTSMDFMVRAISYEMQAKHHVGLRASVVRQLGRVSDGNSGDRVKGTAGTPVLDPGSRLVREWNGATHMVEVTDAGFEWRGDVYGSLSAIAREITGARWSGPRFFGLNGRAGS